MGRVLPLGRDAVGVFYSPSWQDYRTLVASGEAYPSAEMQSVYSTAPADWDMVSR